MEVVLVVPMRQRLLVAEKFLLSCLIVPHQAFCSVNFMPFLLLLLRFELATRMLDHRVVV